jgi:hypothetical protein
MAIHMSAEQLRRSGLLDLPGAPKKAGKKKPKSARAGALSQCATCLETFTGDTAEDEHLNRTGHNRYTTPLEGP